MGKSPRTTNTAATRARKAMLAVAETVVLSTLMDPKSQERYERAGRSKRGKPRVLETYALSGQGSAAVRLQPGSRLLTIEIRHPSFQVDVASAFDLDHDRLEDPAFIRFEGDDKQIARIGGRWRRELEEFDDNPWDSLDALRNLLLVLDQGPSETDAPSDLDVVRAMADDLARQFTRTGAIPALGTADEARLADEPELIRAIVHGMVEAFSSTEANDPVRPAWHMLFVTQLGYLRNAIERGHDWAPPLIESCQHMLIEAGQQGAIRPHDFVAIISAFGEARVDIPEAMRFALATTVADDAEPDSADDRNAIISGMMDEMAGAVTDPFHVVSAMSDAARVLPSEAGTYLAHEFAHSPHQVLRDAAPLLLLSQAQDTRRAAATALDQVARPDTLSPVSLRRMIAIRNWLPNPDRPALDHAIRTARLKGVECAPWPSTDDLLIHATTIDGSGATSLMFTSATGRTGIVAGLLIKLATGVADAWFDQDVPQRVMRGMVKEMSQATETSLVDRPYVDRLLQHAIARNVEIGVPANAELLRVAELVDGAGWQDRRIDIPSEAAELFAALPDDRRTEAAIQQALRRSASWVRDQAFAETWFLDDPTSRSAVKRVGRLSHEKQLDRLVADLMPAYRADWAERMVLLALRAINAHDTRQRARGPDFVTVAHALASDRTLSEIPLMREIARLTLLAGGSE